MCVGAICRLVETWDDDGVPMGRMEDGCTLPLLYVAGARAGDQLLLHLGIPVEVLDDRTAREAIALRTTMAEGGKQ